MLTYKTYFFGCGIVMAGAVLGTAAAAQDRPSDGSLHGVVALGVGVMPEYDGAEDMRAIPFAFGDIRWRHVNIEVRGLRARADLVPSARLSAGPVIGARLSRDDADGAVGLLPDIDTAFEAGAFVGYRFGGREGGVGSLQTELTVLCDVSSTHEGVLATASASYYAVRKPDFSLTFDAQTTWASEDYARTYFGVDPVSASASGLAAYRPDSGFKDVGVGVSAGYWFNKRMGVVGRIGVNYLVGDIADSPITDLGSRWQPTAGITLAYSF